MWIEKLSDGVLRVMTPIGPRYIKPDFWQRLYLVWIFRHFDVLPHQVLSPRQQKLIDNLCTSHRFVSLRHSDSWQEAPIIGTLERRPPVLVEEPSRARAAAVGAGESAHAPLADHQG
jgi:hypothetical protein